MHHASLDHIDPLLPHHDGSELYVSDQAPVLGGLVRVRLRTPERIGAVRSVHTRSNPDHEPRFAVASLIASVDGWQWWEAEIEVENPVHRYRFHVMLENEVQLWVNATGTHTTETRDVDDFVLAAYPAAPEWARSSVLYQVFPDRFARSAAADAHPTPDWAIAAEWGDPVDVIPPGRSQQFYGGDLDGVREHLDHLERLGANLLYLTPVFPARSNHRYDASSFTEVDPLLGGDDALVRLVEAAHERGLKVIGDLTTNHCGDGHEWFRAAYGDPDAPESEFFYWLDDAHTQYVSWLGVPSLPKFNWNSRELRRRFIDGPDSVVARWLGAPYSLDGWRIDVSNMTGRYLDEDLNREVRQTIRRTMIAVNPNTILLGESTNDPAGDFDGDAWHGAMTYANFTRPVWSWLSEPGSRAEGGIGFALSAVPAFTGAQLLEAHRAFAAGLPWRTRLSTMNALDTHDTPRFLTSALPGAVPVAFGLAATLPGIPVIFAGDEFGLTGEDGEASRTPLPWADVAASASTIELYSRTIAVRRSHPALNGGGIRWLHASDDVLVFVRESAEESVLVVAARAAFSVVLPAGSVALGTEGGRVAGDGVRAGSAAAAGPGVGSLAVDEHGRLTADADTRLIGDALLALAEPHRPLLAAADDAPASPALRLTGEGPSFTAWSLPGVTLPPFAPEGTILALA
ncbi:glycoside hydrolase family 13 protein [Compostimonas suwonensis]|uniref:Alpha-glucosidase n=1 Tax=Compostimonas suwonensis TaxID=1048394 RepID=A0A2M9BCV5_9MICO|nr:glycoside hydrolase family 13 protein [Compostimonas suwonensis]PJJ55786.1 alpha-glucosidase [Compostimonas suwonensis]